MPLLVVLLHDTKNRIQRIIAEYSILSGTLPAEEKQKFSHFIEDHKSKSLEELKQCCEELIKQRVYIGVQDVDVAQTRLKNTAGLLFKQVYPDIIPFPFDGYNHPQPCRSW